MVTLSLQINIMPEAEKKFRYTYTFLYQSVAVYATTLAAYLVIRGFVIEKEFGIVLTDPVLFLLSAIIIVSALAIIYNMWLRRRIRTRCCHLRGARVPVPGGPGCRRGSCRRRAGGRPRFRFRWLRRLQPGGSDRGARVVRQAG